MADMFSPVSETLAAGPVVPVSLFFICCYVVVVVVVVFFIVVVE